MESNTTSNITATAAEIFHHYICGVDSAAPLWMRIIALISSVVTVVFGGVGNITAFLAFATSRSLWNFPNINLFLLILNDLLVTLFISSHYMAKYWIGCWPFSQYYCNAFTFLLGPGYVSSQVLVALIAYDRYLMVKLGATYRQQQSAKTVLLRTVPLAIVMPYIGSALLAFTQPVNQWFMPTSEEGAYIAETKCLPHMNINGYQFATASWGYGLGPIVVMLLCYVSVFRRRSGYAQKKGITTVQIMPAAAPQQQPLTASTGLTSPAAPAVFNATTTAAAIRTKTNSRRAARLLNALFAAVLITQTPYIIVSFVTSLIMIGAVPELNRFYWVSLYECASLFAFLNNAVNPLLYAYTMPDFKKAAGDVWRPLHKRVGEGLEWSLKKWQGLL